VLLILTAPNQIVAVDRPQETLQEKVTRIAVLNGVNPDKLANLVESESNWNPQSVGDKGCSYGIAQINICANKEVTKEQALDPDFALQWASTRLAGGKDWLWTVCSCSAYVHVTDPDRIPFQNAKDFTPNGPIQVGSIAIFKYSGVYHVAKVVELKADTFIIREANYVSCKTGTREIKYTERSIIGYWNP
jgi:transglycosylase-like protein with SLT domain